MIPALTLRDYFIAHAPSEPAVWFEPVMPPMPRFDRSDAEGNAAVDWHIERKRQITIQWPIAWADAIMKARQS